MPLMFIPNLGPGEIIVILLIALLLFGAKRLPELGKSLGQGMREFKNSISGINDEEKQSEDTDNKEQSKS